MRLPAVFATAALLLPLSLSLPAQAEEKCELSAPITELMPALEGMKDKLGLSAEQRTAIDNWVAANRPKRQSAEQAVLDGRKRLRDAILRGEAQPVIHKLTDELAALDKSLLELRNQGALMLRNQLTDEQYERVVQRYREGI
ncbi:MAG: hypothetical protein PHI49_07380 [Halothiobacillaceae bacterium]|jgi:hypothetical protein|nr:hypothetical protein [Halothiobacillaceae bacterium]MDY0049560.1 hypothetical protein [Halothiobacillaceae bacterium]